MHNIVYENGIVESELFEIVNIHKPFHSKVDKIKRKASLSKLIISPDETRNSPQIKRYLVSVGNRFAYKMHVTYKGDLKCHNIYDTNSSVDRILRSKVIKTLIDEIDQFPNLGHDLRNIIRVIAKSWDFDCIVTDIPWLTGNYHIPVINADWSLLKSNSNDVYFHTMNLVIKEYSKIPLNILPYSTFENLNIDNTNIDDLPYKCPLFLMMSNSYYAGYLANVMNRGLAVALFKVVGKVY